VCFGGCQWKERQDYSKEFTYGVALCGMKNRFCRRLRVAEQEQSGAEFKAVNDEAASRLSNGIGNLLKLGMMFNAP
jgi:hypothetical protein